MLALNAKRETGTNVIEVMDNFKTQIAKVNKDILAPRGWGLELFQVYHQTIYVRESVENARTDLLLDTAGWRRMNRPKPNPRSNQPQAAKQNPPLARTVTPSQA